MSYFQDRGNSVIRVPIVVGILGLVALGFVKLYKYADSLKESETRGAITREVYNRDDGGFVNYKKGRAYCSYKMIDDTLALVSASGYDPDGFALRTDVVSEYADGTEARHLMDALRASACDGSRSAWSQAVAACDSIEGDFNSSDRKAKK